MVTLSADQKRMILDFVAECKEDGVKDDRLPYELQSFIGSLGNQTHSQDLRELATDPSAIAQLLQEVKQQKAPTK